MKKNYISPKFLTTFIDTELLIAASEKMEVGEGSGNNIPEVKREFQNPSQGRSVEWDDWSN